MEELCPNSFSLEVGICLLLAKRGLAPVTMAVVVSPRCSIHPLHSTSLIAPMLVVRREGAWLAFRRLNCLKELGHLVRCLDRYHLVCVCLCVGMRNVSSYSTVLNDVYSSRSPVMAPVNPTTSGQPSSNSESYCTIETDPNLNLLYGPSVCSPSVSLSLLCSDVLADTRLDR